MRLACNSRLLIDNAPRQRQALAALKFASQLAVNLCRAARAGTDSAADFAFFQGIAMANNHGESNILLRCILDKRIEINSQ